jgi:hypothetical protein
MNSNVLIIFIEYPYLKMLTMPILMDSGKEFFKAACPLNVTSRGGREADSKRTSSAISGQRSLDRKNYYSIQIKLFFQIV